eukprot:5255430-Pleurochrysis_carterae.AAC.3
MARAADGTAVSFQNPLHAVFSPPTPRAQQREGARSNATALSTVSYAQARACHFSQQASLSAECERNRGRPLSNLATRLQLCYEKL